MFQITTLSVISLLLTISQSLTQPNLATQTVGASEATIAVTGSAVRIVECDDVSL
jgi:hypothetical protein